MRILLFYSDEFRSIYKVNEDITEAELVWNENWEVLIDGMLQLNTLRQPYAGVAQPSQIRDITIDVDKHFKSCNNFEKKQVLKATVDPTLDSIS